EQSDDRTPGRDLVLGSGAAVVGLSRPRRDARGPGEGGAAPVVLPQLLWGAGVRHAAARVPGLPERRGAPRTRQGPARAVPDRPLGGPMARDLMFQQEIKETVQQAYAAIAGGGGETVARRPCGAKELAEAPAGAVPWALGVGNPVRYARLQPGQAVLDVGSGGGIENLLAARGVGAQRRAT